MKKAEKPYTGRQCHLGLFNPYLIILKWLCFVNLASTGCPKKRLAGD